MKRKLLIRGAALLAAMLLAGCGGVPSGPAAGTDPPGTDAPEAPTAAVELPPLPPLPELPPMPTAPEIPPVGQFDDAQLEQSVRGWIRNQTGEKPGDPLTQADLDHLTKLVINGPAVTSLNGLQNCPHLEEIYLSGTGSTDISALQGCSALKRLTLSGVETDISVLQCLTGLESLDLNTSGHTDISALQALTNLRILRLGYNEITDLAALQDLTGLEELYLSGDPVVDVSPLQKLTGLRYLDVVDTPVDPSSLSVLSRALPDLEICLYRPGV